MRRGDSHKAGFQKPKCQGKKGLGNYRVQNPFISAKDGALTVDISAAANPRDKVFEVPLAVMGGSSQLPPTFVGNLKPIPNIAIDRVFFHAIGIVMIMATLAAGAVMVSLAINNAKSEIYKSLVSEVENGV